MTPIFKFLGFTPKSYQKTHLTKMKHTFKPFIIRYDMARTGFEFIFANIGGNMEQMLSQMLVLAQDIDFLCSYLETLLQIVLQYHHKSVLKILTNNFNAHQISAWTVKALIIMQSRKLRLLDVGVVDKPTLDEIVMDEPVSDDFWGKLHDHSIKNNYSN